MTRDEQRIDIEPLFRTANEEMESLVDTLRLDLAEFLCECGGDDCCERISLTVSEYEAVRSQPSRFVVAPGHELAAGERVVSSNGRYAIVEPRVRATAPAFPRARGRLTARGG